MADRKMNGYFLSLRRAWTDDGEDDGTAIFVAALSFPCPNREEMSGRRIMHP